MPPGFDRLESFGHYELSAKPCYFRCSRPPDDVNYWLIKVVIANCKD